MEYVTSESVETYRTTKPPYFWFRPGDTDSHNYNFDKRISRIPLDLWEKLSDSEKIEVCIFLDSSGRYLYDPFSLNIREVSPNLASVFYLTSSDKDKCYAFFGDLIDDSYYTLIDKSY